MSTHLPRTRNNQDNSLKSTVFGVLTLLRFVWAPLIMTEEFEGIRLTAYSARWEAREGEINATFGGSTSSGRHEEQRPNGMCALEAAPL